MNGVDAALWGEAGQFDLERTEVNYPVIWFRWGDNIAIGVPEVVVLWFIIGAIVTIVSLYGLTDLMRKKRWGLYILGILLPPYAFIQGLGALIGWWWLASGTKTLEIEKLKVQIARLKRMTFGASSERVSRELVQLELKLEELEAAEAGAEAATETAPAVAEEFAPEDAPAQKGLVNDPEGVLVLAAHVLHPVTEAHGIAIEECLPDTCPLVFAEPEGLTQKYGGRQQG
jgi:hypothetical protein